MKSNNLIILFLLCVSFFFVFYIGYSHGYTSGKKEKTDSLQSLLNNTRDSLWSFDSYQRIEKINQQKPLAESSLFKLILKPQSARNKGTDK